MSREVDLEAIGRGMGMALFAALLFACSSEPMTTPPDGGVEDVDGGIEEVDAGARALCPVPENNPACAMAEDCADNRPAQTNCRFCREYNKSVCALGRCETPAALMVTDIHDYAFDVVGLETLVHSLAGVVMAAETTGGNQITCQDVYAAAFNLDEPCYNILDTRGLGISQMSQTYTMSFNQFPSGRPVLFIVYGFELENADGSPIGVSCKEWDVGEPGSGRVRLPGDRMKRIQ